MLIRVLAVGDVCGKPGLEHLRRTMPGVRKAYHIDFAVVNGENANVVGVTPAQCEEIFDAGADVITLGNHTWTRTEIRDYLDRASRVLRPANYAPQCPGRGVGVYETSFGPVRVINAMGRFTLDGNTDNPFVVVDNIFADEDVKITLVDFHAEATSEKLAMGYFLEGRASAVWGGHPHPCPDIGLLCAARRHGIYHRPRDDGAEPQRAGHRRGAEHRQVPGRPAPALRLRRREVQDGVRRV